MRSRKLALLQIPLLSLFLMGTSDCDPVGPSPANVERWAPLNKKCWWTPSPKKNNFSYDTTDCPEYTYPMIKKNPNAYPHWTVWADSRDRDKTCFVNGRTRNAGSPPKFQARAFNAPYSPFQIFWHHGVEMRYQPNLKELDYIEGQGLVEKPKDFSCGGLTSIGILDNGLAGRHLPLIHNGQRMETVVRFIPNFDPEAKVQISADLVLEWQPRGKRTKRRKVISVVLFPFQPNSNHRLYTHSPDPKIWTYKRRYGNKNAAVEAIMVDGAAFGFHNLRQACPNEDDCLGIREARIDWVQVLEHIKQNYPYLDAIDRDPVKIARRGLPSYDELIGLVGFSATVKDRKRMVGFWLVDLYSQRKG